MNTNLNPALSLVDRYLAQFATSPNFWSDFELAFGKNFDQLTAEQIRQKLSVGGFTRSIQIVQDQVLGLASGAFAAATNTVYLRESLVASGDLEHISEVIIEEYGHSIDSLVNKEETPGDEGAIFRLLVKGFKLTQAMLAELRAEDDWAVISIDGQQLAVEMAIFNGTTGNDTLGGVVAGDNVGDDLFYPITGQDVVAGGDGNDTLFIDYSSRTTPNPSTSLYEGIRYDVRFISLGNGIGSSSYSADNISDSVSYTGIENFNITGSQFNDFISLLNVFGAGTLIGGGGNDSLIGGSSNDSLLGGIGNDSLDAGSGEDIIYGGDGDDIIYGGRDILTSRTSIRADNGNDFLDGGAGKNQLFGGGGNDIYAVNAASGGTIIDDYRGSNDNLQLSFDIDINTGLTKAGRNLIIDLNNDQLFDATNDLTIKNFFGTPVNFIYGLVVDDGFIETVQNLSGTDIINRFTTIGNDFNNDKASDILLRNTDGGIGLWKSNNITPTTDVILPSFDKAWKIAGTGDFNGDNKSDILWRNDDGKVGLWQMDGTNILSTDTIAPWFYDNAWKISATGDFNGDRKSDILWRNDDGRVGIWQMNGANILSTDVVAPWFYDNAWKIVGTGDFDGDQKSDVLWRNDNGDLGAWYMDGKNVSYSPNYGTSEKIKGINDFNGDGFSDVLLANDDGTISIFGIYKNDGGRLLDTFTPDQHIIGTGDFNGDKKADILWQSTDGSLSTWLLDGTTVLAKNAIIGIDNTWSIAAPHI
jgi:RTX calcium-binding nonapeptide repeat (4 copies)/FG-GAP-like repeat